MRTLLENWRLLALAVALAAIAGESARAQAPGRTINEPASGAPRAVAPAAQATGNRTKPPVKQIGNGAQPAATAPATAATQPPREPLAPFKLSPAEQQLLDEVLKKWEGHNSKIKTIKIDFQRREYDLSLADEPLPKKDDPDLKAKLELHEALKESGYLRSIAKGLIKYKPPDQGMFRITKMHEYDPNIKKGPKDPLLTEVKENLEHWVCDGTAIHEFKPDPDGKKGEHLIHIIPKEMRGEAIADGPVPFIFGAKADKMKTRYWMREATPKEEQGQHVWLEIFPKFQQDAANFRHVKVVLTAKEHSLYALMIELPSGKQQTTFTFGKPTINDFFGGIKGDFDPPETPSGWRRTVDPPPDAPTASNPDAPAAGAREAKRGPAAAKPR